MLKSVLLISWELLSLKKKKKKIFKKNNSLKTKAHKQQFTWLRISLLYYQVTKMLANKNDIISYIAQ